MAVAWSAFLVMMAALHLDNPEIDENLSFINFLLVLGAIGLELFLLGLAIFQEKNRLKFLNSAVFLLFQPMVFWAFYWLIRLKTGS